MQPRESIGRVCRIAFELLKGNGNSYDSIANTYSISERALRRAPDFLATQYLNDRSSIGRKRNDRALQSDHLDTLLVPYQHGPELQSDEPRKFELNNVGKELFYVDTTIAVIRMLQLRISQSSYAFNRLRFAPRTFEDFRICRREFELVLQEATAYNTDSRTTYTHSDKLERPTKIIGKFLFPAEFMTGRRSTDISNEYKSLVTTESTKTSYSLTSSLYMATAVSTLKTLQRVKPAKHPKYSTEYQEMRLIMREMASIADKMRSIGPFLRFVVTAAENLPYKYKFVKRTLLMLQLQLQPLVDTFAQNHAKFDDAIRSYADFASCGFLNVETLEYRFLRAYESIRKFKQRYDIGSIGMLVYLGNEFNGGRFQRQTEAITTPFFEAIESLITSDRFIQPALTIQSQLNLRSTLQLIFVDLPAYTILSARFHLNSALGCVTAAAPFRSVPSQINNVAHRRAIRESMGFDTMNGFLTENGDPTLFHCFLPSASDIFTDGIEESCDPVVNVATSTNDVDDDPEQTVTTLPGQPTKRYDPYIDQNRDGYDPEILDMEPEHPDALPSGVS